MAEVSSKDLDRELRSVFAAPDFDMDAETVKSIKKQVTKRLGAGTFPKALKGEFKDLLQRLLDENDESEQEEDENTVPVKRNEVKAKKSSSTKSKKSAAPSNAKQKNTTKAAPVKKASSSAYSANVQSLLDLGQAMRMGPRLHRGLKDMEEDTERISALTQRLEDAGATWKGEFPSPSDVAKAKAERQKQDDLDGIDTSLIIEEGRGRHRGRTSINYAVDNHDSNVEDDDEEGKEFDDDESTPPRKKSKGCSDDNKDSDGDFDGSESSDAEAEFD